MSNVCIILAQAISNGWKPFYAPTQRVFASSDFGAGGGYGAAPSDTANTNNAPVYTSLNTNLQYEPAARPGQFFDQPSQVDNEVVGGDSLDTAPQVLSRQSTDNMQRAHDRSIGAHAPCIHGTHLCEWTVELAAVFEEIRGAESTGLL
jgi:hypothetical protein